MENKSKSDDDATSRKPRPSTNSGNGETNSRNKSFGRTNQKAGAQPESTKKEPDSGCTEQLNKAAQRCEP